MPWGRAVVVGVGFPAGDQGEGCGPEIFHCHRTSVQANHPTGRRGRLQCGFDVAGMLHGNLLRGMFGATCTRRERAPRTRRNVSLTRRNVYPRTRWERVPPHTHRACRLVSPRLSSPADRTASPPFFPAGHPFPGRDVADARRMKRRRKTIRTRSGS